MGKKPYLHPQRSSHFTDRGVQLSFVREGGDVELVLEDGPSDFLRTTEEDSEAEETWNIT